MKLTPAFENTYFTFFPKSKNVTLRFLLYCIRFLEQWLSHIVRKSHSEYWYCHSICGRRYNSPGAAAPGDVLLHLVQNHHFFGFLQPVGLVDYESLKKSIWRFLLFSRLCLKEFTDDTEISSSDKLFQQFMTRWEKNYNRVLQRQCLSVSSCDL